MLKWRQRKTLPLIAERWDTLAEQWNILVKNRGSDGLPTLQDRNTTGSHVQALAKHLERVQRERGLVNSSFIISVFYNETFQQSDPQLVDFFLLGKSSKAILPLILHIILQIS